jgi:hypothetical protein
MEDKVEPNQTKGMRTAAFSVQLPIDLNGKVEYIKKRTFLSKQRIILMTCSKNIEGWCKQLMDEELAIRAAGGKVTPNLAAPPPAMPMDVPGPHRQASMNGACQRGVAPPSLYPEPQVQPTVPPYYVPTYPDTLQGHVITAIAPPPISPLPPPFKEAPYKGGGKS